MRELIDIIEGGIILVVMTAACSAFVGSIAFGAVLGARFALSVVM